MAAMLILLLRFCPRKSAGTPKVAAPAARAVVLINWRRVGRLRGPDVEFMLNWYQKLRFRLKGNFYDIHMTGFDLLSRGVTLDWTPRLPRRFP